MTTDPTATDRVAFPYQPGLDGIRALSVLAVIAYHNGYQWAAGGFLGVDAFFVLSGFLITTLLVLEYRRADAIGLVAFWGRRFRRLLPALFLMLLVSAVVGAAILHPFELTRFRWDGLASLFYVANWRFILSGQSYFDVIASPSPFRHLWSLAIEEQFYLIWPLVVLACLRIRKGRVDLLVAVCVAGTAASAVAMAALYDAKDPSRAYFGTDTRVHTMLIGALLALLLLHRRPSRPWATNTVQAAGALSLGAIAWAWHVTGATSRGYYGAGSLVFALGVAVVVSAATAPRGIVGRALGIGPLRGVGRISYGLYLWHWPVIVWLTPDRVGLEGNRLIAVRLAVTFVVAGLSFRLLEEPVRTGRWFPRGSGVARFVAPLGIAMLAVVMIGTTVGAEAPPNYLVGFPSECPPPTHAEIDAAAAQLRQRPVPVPPVPSPVIAVIGDSVACSLRPGLSAIEATSPYRFQVGAVVACGVVSGQVIANAEVTAVPAGTDRCDELATQRRRAAVAGRAPVVLWASTWERSDLDDHGHRVRAGSRAWRALVTRRVDTVVGEMARQGTHVVMLTVPPRSEGLVGTTVVPSTPGDERAFVRLNALLREIAHRHPEEITVLDFSEYVCPSGPPCPRERDGFAPRSVDGAHYTPAGSIWALDWLLPRITAAESQAHGRA